MPPKLTRKKKPPAGAQKKKAPKGAKGKGKAKAEKKGKGTKGIKKKVAAAPKASKDGAAGATATKGHSNGAEVTHKHTEVKVPEQHDDNEVSWMHDHVCDGDEETTAENAEADGQGDIHEGDDADSTDEIVRYFDNLEARVMSTLANLPYHVTSITETVQNAFRQHRMSMPIPENMSTSTSGLGSMTHARHDLSSGTGSSSLPTCSGWGSRTGTFLLEEFGGRWAVTGGTEMEGDPGGYLTEEEVYQTVQSYSAEVRRELSCRHTNDLHLHAVDTVHKAFLINNRLLLFHHCLLQYIHT